MDEAKRLSTGLAVSVTQAKRDFFKILPIAGVVADYMNNWRFVTAYVIFAEFLLHFMV